MESINNFRARFEVLEQQRKARGAYTRTAERRLRWWWGIACGLVMLGLLSWALPLGAAQDLLQQPSLSPQVPEPSTPVTRLGAYGYLPLSFEANQGQADDQVQFLARGQGYTLFLTAREAVFAFRPPAAHGSRSTSRVLKRRAGQDIPASAQAVVRMQLLGANPVSQVVGLEELSGKSNYFIGNDPKKWSCTRTLRIIVSPRKLTTMPPLHHRVRERCHDSSSCLLPAGDPGMSVALHHAALRLAQPSHRVTPKATRTCVQQG